MTLYKEYTVISGQFVSENFLLSGFNGTDQPAPPAWFEFINGAIILGTQTYAGYQFTAPPSLGTYDVFFRPFIDEASGAYYVRINVVIGAYNLYENCCGDRNIAWLGVHGGWQNYIFTGIKTFQVEIDGSKQFKTSELVKKHSQIDGVYNGEVITTGDIPQSHVSALDGLKYAIQVFLFNEETQAWDIPILVDVESFTKFKSRDKLFDVRLKFIYAEEILVQTQ